MSSAEDVECITLVLPFKGTSWEECNTFIRSIRAYAWIEGKQRDDAWMADYAALHFSQGALSWHSRLPRDVRQDWSQLETALLERWPSPETIDGLEIQPTPAAAPSVHSSNKLSGYRPLQGVLKVIISGPNNQFYVKYDSNHCTLTRNVREALRVRSSSVGETVILERTDGSSHSRLALGWWKPTPNLNRGSADFASLLKVTPEEMGPLWSSEGPWQIMTCTVCASGRVMPTWITGPQKITLSPLVSFPYLRLAADPKARKLGKGAKLCIEPVA